MTPTLILTVVTIVVTSYLAWLQYRRSRPLRITALYLYPVKSCRGIQVDSADFTRLGFKYDRQWMIVNAHTNNMVTAREIPSMVLITPKIDEKAGTLTLTYKDHGPLTVPLTPPETDATVTVWEAPLKARRYGAIASKWVTSVLTEVKTAPSPNAAPQEFHLVSIVSPEEHQRPLPKNYDWNVDTKSQKIQTAFADGFPLLLASESSLRLLNTWTRPTRDTEMRTFRPNIVVDGGSLKPFDEDEWRKVQIGEQKDMEFVVTKPCERCVLTTVVPDKGERHESGEPLISLRKHRKMLPDCPKFKDSVFFGQNLLHRVPKGTLRVGDLLHIRDRKVGGAFLEFSPAYLAKMKPGSEEEKKRLEEYGI